MNAHPATGEGRYRSEMTRLIALLLLVPALAFAQPAEPAPADAEPSQRAAPVLPATDAETPPGEPPPPPQPPEPVAPPAVPAAANERPQVETASTHEKRGLTGEVSVGLAMFSSGGQTEVVHGIAGLNFGVGGFVSPRIALSLRVAGATILDQAFLYVGVIGPNVQAWLAPQLWVGGGIGLGGYTGCGGGNCDAVKALGYDLRLGYSFAPDGNGVNASVETTSIDWGYGDGRLNTLGLLLGYQGF